MEKPTVLIIDDARNIRLTLRATLEQPGWEIDETGNGEEGLALLETGRYHMALLDLDLPGMHGMEVLRRIRKSRPEVDIIIITAYGTIEYSVEALKVGALDFITKPFTPDQVRTAVEQVMVRRTQPLSPSPDDAQGLIQAAKSSIKQGDFHQGLSRLQKSVALDPTNHLALNMLGAMMEITGRKLEAQKCYRAALALEPRYQPARQNLERLVLGQGRGEINLGK